MFLVAFCGFAGDLLFLSAIRKKKITKRKTAGCRSEAEKSGISLNEKNSLRSNSFSFFTGNARFFFTLLHGGRRLFFFVSFSFARTKETKQRRVVEDLVRKKFAVCTFWATPASVSAKQKELASLKQLFVFNAPTLTSASRPKSEAGPFSFYATSLHSLGCGVFFFLLRLLG